MTTKVVVSAFRPYRKNTLRGFFVLELGGGIQVRDCTLHEQNGAAWCGFPGVPFTAPDGTTKYKAVVTVPDASQLASIKEQVLEQLAEHLEAGNYTLAASQSWNCPRC